MLRKLGAQEPKRRQSATQSSSSHHSQPPDLWLRGPGGPQGQDLRSRSCLKREHLRGQPKATGEQAHPLKELPTQPKFVRPSPVVKPVPMMPNANSATHTHARMPGHGACGLAGSVRKERVTGSDRVRPVVRSVGSVRQQGMCTDLKHTGRTSSAPSPTPGL